MASKRYENAGRREREARKRHRRGRIWSNTCMAADDAPLKLGSKHMRRFMRNCHSGSGGARNRSKARKLAQLAKGAEESVKQHQPV